MKGNRGEARVRLLRRIMLASAVLTTPIGLGDAFAQAQGANAQSDDNRLQDIVVTAQKREQSLSKVGISITALSGDALENAGIKDTMSIVNSVPNMENSAIYGPGSNTNFSIRGVSQNDHNDGTESPVAAYNDEVYIVPNGAGSFPLYDMERVEVLRGPQGTLFGRNSTGGLIHFISAKPTDEFEGSVSALVGSYDSREVTGVLNLPLTQGVDFRVAGQIHQNDAWVKNISGLQPNGGQLKTQSVRGQLRLKPSSAVTDIIKVSYDHADGTTSGTWKDAIGIDAVTGNQFVLGAGQDFYGTGPQTDALGQPNITDRRTNNGQIRELRDAHSTTIANHLDIELGNVTVTAVTGFNRYHRDQVEDCDATPVRACATRYITNSRMLSQELRATGDFGDLRFTAGLFYLRHRLKLNNIAPLFLDTPGAIALTVRANQLSKSYAIFGNVEFDLSPQLTVIAGLRGSKDKKHFEQVLNVNLPCDPANPFPGYASINPADVPVCGQAASNVFTDETVGALTRIDKNTWTAKLELDFKPTESTLIYGSFSRGVKSPGFNNGFISTGLAAENFQFKSETLLAYEVGLKTQLLDRRASLSLSSFYYDYSNYDTLSFAGVGSVITNNDAELYGAEAEFQIRPVRGLTISMNAGYTHSKLYDVPNAALVVADREMPLAPKWTVGGSARYETNIFPDAHRLGLQLDARGRGAFFANPGNDSAARLGSIGLVDARIDLTAPNDRYTIALSAKNLFDKHYFSSVFLEQGIGGYRFGNYGMPRWISGEVTVRF